jgi:UDP-N-acetylglucosamine/UDP-N-acetylgalactosamine diphosphorylase
MSSLGIEHLHVYGIDNILTRSADPLFLGYCISNSFQLGNKVVSRLNAAEKVGVTALHSFRDPITGTMEPNRLCIVEYSELPPECTGEDVSTGQLIYSAANICNHYFSLSFLLNQVYPHLSSSYHIANKKIPCYDLSSNSTVTPLTNNGIKLEMFIFDIFSLANSYGVFEVDREEEFAPVKNAPGAATDSPDTARELLSNQCLRWLQTAGVEIVEATDMNSDIDFQGSEGESLKKECEISPLLSYSGEGLEHLRGAKMSLPCYLRDFTVTNDLQF